MVIRMSYDDTDWYCSSCNAHLNEQSGYESAYGSWTCTECGNYIDLTDNDDICYDSMEDAKNARFLGVKWYCDNCETLLNRQPGFDDNCYFWMCTDCGHMNTISEAEIYSSKQEYDIFKTISDIDWFGNSNSNDENTCDDDDSDDDSFIGNSSSSSWNQQYEQQPMITIKTEPIGKAPLKQRFWGIIIFIAMTICSIILMDFAFDSFFSTHFGLTLFELASSIVLIRGGYLSRKASKKNGSGYFKEKLKGIFGNVAMKITGLLLIFVNLDIYSDISLLLRIGIGIALIIGGHFIYKKMG